MSILKGHGPNRHAGFRWLLRLGIVTVLVGIGAGVGGGLLSLLLHGVEHVAFGYGDGSLLTGAASAAPLRRFLVVLSAGVVGAIGWCCLRRWSSPVVSIAQSVAGKRMPRLTTVLNSTLQIIVVGLGASVGREVAHENWVRYSAIG